MNRSKIIDKLGCCVSTILSEVEKACGLQVQFQALSKSPVVAQYSYDPCTSTATIFLRSDWEDVDVAHELMHMKMELVKGFIVLAWRRRIDHTPAIESAFGRIRNYADDEVVHSWLAKQGLVVDKEVLKSQLFEDIYTNVPRYLAKMLPREQDGMAHLDKDGYGELCRCSFLIQAELVRSNYNSVLSDSHRQKLNQFINVFRAHRSVEAAKADQVLVFFRANDITTVEGHRHILDSWAQLENLNRFVGLSAYTKNGNGYILPWP